MQQQKYGKKKFLGFVPPKRIDINAELVLIISNENFQQFGKNITEVISYFAIFMHAVNDRFASINSKYLKIKATIVGIIANEVKCPEIIFKAF